MALATARYNRFSGATAWQPDTGWRLWFRSSRILVPIKPVRAGQAERGASRVAARAAARRERFGEHGAQDQASPRENRDLARLIDHAQARAARRIR